MTCSRRVIRTPVDRRCKVEGTVKTTLKFDFEINHIDTKKKKKKKSDERDIHNLEVGCGRGGLGLDGNKARNGKEAAHMFKDTCDVGGGRDGRCGKKDAGSDIESSLENDIGVNVFPEVSVDLPDKIRGDRLGTDGRSGRRR
jgi:hypothetical protein